jgi:hypothetical protein
LSKGITAIDGLSGSGCVGRCAELLVERYRLGRGRRVQVTPERVLTRLVLGDRLAAPAEPRVDFHQPAVRFFAGRAELEQTPVRLGERLVLARASLLGRTAQQQTLSGVLQAHPRVAHEVVRGVFSEHQARQQRTAHVVGRGAGRRILEQR